MGAIKKRFTGPREAPAFTGNDVAVASRALGLTPPIPFDDSPAKDVVAAPESGPPEASPGSPPTEEDFSKQQAALAARPAPPALSPLQEVAKAVFDATTPHVCYRCRSAPGLPAYCGFCHAQGGGNVNARVDDLFMSRPAHLPEAAYRRAVFALLDTCMNAHMASELARYIDQHYPVLRAIVDAVFKE